MTSNEEEEEGSGLGWIIMIALLASIALYCYNKATFRPPELTLPEIPVVLQTSPFFGVSHDGDAGTHYFLDFKLAGNTEFKLTDCRYSATNDSITRLLVAGDTLMIRAKGYPNEVDGNIYSIVSPCYGTILEYTGIADCNLNEARIYIVLSISFIVLAVCWLLERRTLEQRVPDSENETDPTWTEFIHQYQQVLAGTITISQFKNNALGLCGAHRDRLNAMIGKEYDTGNYDGLNMLIIAARRSPSRTYTTTLCMIVDGKVDSVINENIVDLLCYLGDPTTVPTLIRAAQTEWPLDKQMHLNRKCIRTLGMIDTDEAIRGLQELTQHPSIVISHEAQNELERINNA